MTFSIQKRPAAAFACAVLALSLHAAPSLAADGQAALKALIEQAKKEPQAIDGSMTRVLLGSADLIKKANEMFNKQFGLDKKITIVEGTDNKFTGQMMAELDAGAKPKLAFFTTNSGDMPVFVAGNYAQKIDNWDALLTEINPRVKSGEVKPTDISREGYSGYAFAHSNRLKAVGYNKNMASPKDLPQSYVEMGDAKYKGQYAIEPWTSHWKALGFNYYPDKLDQFKGLMDKITENAYIVARSHQMVPRMAQGEIKFITLNAEVVTDFLAKNPGAPVDFYFMNDMTLIETTMMFIARNGPAPATGTLWIMYLSHPEIQALRGADAPNVMYGNLPNDKVMMNQLSGKNAWDWKMNDKTTEYWKWINQETGPGKELDGYISNSIRRRTS